MTIGASFQTFPQIKIAMRNLFLLLMSMISTLSGAVAMANETYEVRRILMDDSSDEAAIDAYLESALIPALSRQGVGPVGVLHPHEADKMGVNAIFVIVPYRDANQVNEVRETLASDEQYLSDAAEYLAHGPKDSPYVRMESELLIAMDCWPKTVVQEGTTANPERVFELRLYESPNERLGDLKVDMFNAGEVPIFLDCKIQPVFIGQCVLGPQAPSLTYLTVYESEDARAAAWKSFTKNPDWQVLKKVAKYGGTVSHIDKFVLQAKPYSQM